MEALKDLDAGLRAGNWGAVIARCDAILRRSPSTMLRATALRCKGHALLALNPVFAGAAVAALREAMELPHADPKERAKAACLLAAAYAADPAMARRYAELAQSLDDGSGAVTGLVAAAWFNVGFASRRAGQLPSAEAAYLRALTLRQAAAAAVVPEGAVENNLADVLLDAGRVAEAIAWLAQADAVLADAFRPAYLELRARAALLQGDLPAAEQFLDQGLSHPAATEHNRAAALLTRARIHLAAGRRTAARELAQEAFTRAGLLGDAWICDCVAAFITELEEAEP